ncbi:MAG TPA: ABC-2 family transporter protein [Rhizomicrobium sp.]|jgi:ABC-2 type transport system permease protein|nr:ABC-2 family transporter protein [Rhizomicrobium sp.]
MNALALYRRLIGVAIRSEMLYPSSFLLRFGSQFVVTIIEFGGIYVLFERFKHIRGWGFAEVALFYAVASIAFALADALSRGFDSMGPMLIKTGNFDRVLLRPRGSVLQIVGREIFLSSAGRLLQGLVALVVAVGLLKLDWSVGDGLLLAWAVAGGTSLFFSLKMMEGVLSFWTTEGLEVANTLTYGGEAAAQFPLDIYTAWFRKLLLYGVPIGCSLYLPVALVLGHDTGAPAWLAVLAPLTGFAFLGVAAAFWRFGIGHYTSTGS